MLEKELQKSASFLKTQPRRQIVAASPSPLPAELQAPAQLCFSFKLFPNLLEELKATLAFRCSSFPEKDLSVLLSLHGNGLAVSRTR